MFPTFEDWADLPNTNGPLSVKLTQHQLHEEEGDSPQKQHGKIGDKEGTWKYKVGSNITMVQY